MKTLYFEGAGWPETEKEYGLNCRIRTAFTNDKGNKIYLEILCGHKEREIIKGPKYEDIPDHYMIVDSCNYITEDTENVQLVTNKEGHSLERDGNRTRPYTKEDILKFVNEECGCSFDAVEVLPEFSGYRVHKDSSRAGIAAAYNFGDEFPYDEERTKKIAGITERKYVEHF